MKKIDNTYLKSFSCCWHVSAEIMENLCETNELVEDSENSNSETLDRYHSSAFREKKKELVKYSEIA